MPTITPTTTITIDGTIIQVTDASDAVRNLITYLDEWRQDEVDQASQLLKTRSALRDIQNQLVLQLQQEHAEAEAAAAEYDAEVEAAIGEDVDQEPAE